MIELNEQKAKDLDEILKVSLEKGQSHSSGFDLSWYRTKKRPDFSDEYIYHLHSLMKFFNEKYNRKWVTLDVRTYVRANPNTEYFLENGGYKKVLKDELREESIKNLTEKQLKKNIFQMKYWWWILIINGVISAAITFLFSKYFF